MTAPVTAIAIGSSTPHRRRHLAHGVAAAGALSLAVHAAVLFVRLPTGGAAADGSPPPAPVLLTRIVVAPESAVAARVEPAPAAAPAPTAPSPPPEAARADTVITTPDRDAAKARPAVSPQPAVAPPEPAAAPRPPVTRPVAEPPPSVEPPTAPAPPSAALTYHGALGLDPPPRPLGDIEPAVPEAAGTRGGVVVLRLYINEQGTVDRAEVLRSTPAGLFDGSAVEAFSNARFSPGYLAGVPVKSQMTIEVKYRALGSGTESSTRTY